MPETAKLDFQFSEELHQYVVENELQPHVTGILQQYGITDYSGIPEFTLKRKTLIGTIAHEVTQHIDADRFSLDLALGMVMDSRSELCAYYEISNQDLEPYCLAHLKFREESDFIPWLVEYRRVAVINGMLCGMQIDLAGLLRNKPTILDRKCCHGKEKSWPVQLAGYGLGLPRDVGVPPEHGPIVRWERAVLWYKPNATYSILPGGRDKSDSILERRDEEVFLAALRMAHWKRENLGHY